VASPIAGGRLPRVPSRAVILDSSELPIEEFERETGWLLKTEGACRGGVCVPVPLLERSVDLGVVAERLGMALVHDEGHRLWALGPSTVSGRALESADAPDFTLPDLAGRPFRFGSLRGRKVVLVAWASW
jgi:hypothetical protein